MCTASAYESEIQTTKLTALRIRRIYLSRYLVVTDLDSSDKNIIYN